MTDMEQAEVNQNKAIRGYIISPDISKHLNYLQGAGYIEFTSEKVTAYTAYAKDAVIRLTKSGVDLAEGTIDDPGVDV